jgi:hypothetical protein
MKDSPNIDCKFSGAQLGARTDADVSHPADIIICPRTGETEKAPQCLTINQQSLHLLVRAI